MSNATEQTTEQIVGALIHVFNNQTADEQDSDSTKYENGIGFNGTDSNFLSSVAKQVISKKTITTKQLAAVSKAMKKYHRQYNNDNSFSVTVIDNTIKTTRDNELKVTQLGDNLKITFRYSADLVSQIKSLDGRRWNPSGKFWTAPDNSMNRKKLDALGFSLPASKSVERKQVIKKIDLSVLDNLPLYDYQKEGVNFLQSKNGRALVADEMGLGKTIQALAWLKLNPQALPAVVVCPASLKLNWALEIKKWNISDSVFIANGNTANGLISADITIINYDIVKSWVDYLNPKTVILDECHYIKNSKAQRTKAVRKLCKGKAHVIALSGTPILNKPIEMFNTLSILDNKEYRDFWGFARRYCNAKHNGFGWDFSGASKTTELHQRLTSTVMIRRLKENVLTELPAKVRSVVPLEINQRQYKAAHIEALKEIKEGSGAGAAVLTEIEKLKQITVNLKLKSAIKWIEDYLEEGAKLVVFATHHQTLDRLRDHFSDISVTIDGRTSQIARQDAVERFQGDDQIRLMLGNIKAAGVGLTMTAAHATCFIEFGWTPGEHVQAEDRVHRIGQTSDSVMAYYLIAPDTIDETITSMIDTKAKVLSQVLDGKALETDSMLSELLDSMLNE